MFKKLILLSLIASINLCAMDHKEDKEKRERERKQFEEAAFRFTDLTAARAPHFTDAPAKKPAGNRELKVNREGQVILPKSESKKDSETARASRTEAFDIQYLCGINYDNGSASPFRHPFAHIILDYARPTLQEIAPKLAKSAVEILKIDTPTPHVLEALFSQDGTRIFTVGRFLRFQNDFFYDEWDITTGAHLSHDQGFERFNNVPILSQCYLAYSFNCMGYKNTPFSNFFGTKRGIETTAYWKFQCPSPNERYSMFWTNNNDDNNVYIKHADTNEIIKIMKGHTANVLSARFNTTATHVITSSDNGSVRIWALDYPFNFTLEQMNFLRIVEEYSKNHDSCTLDDLVTIKKIGAKIVSLSRKELTEIFDSFDQPVKQAITRAYNIQAPKKKWLKKVLVAAGATALGIAAYLGFKKCKSK